MMTGAGVSIATLHDSLAAPTVDTDVRPRRIALYSHDTQGLGHIRRNLAIADALGTATPAPDVLLVSGVREAGALPMPPNTDVLSLPALFKSESGHYGARSLSTSLDDLVELRAQTIGAALEVFQPDVLVVDKVARGAFGELEPALHTIAARPDARMVLGLRDVLDDAATTCGEWNDAATTDAIHEFYDAVWIYGDRRVFNPVKEYGLPGSVAAMVRHTGYLAPAAPDPNRATAGVAGLIDSPYALCLVGGGQDGERLATAFLGADLPIGTAGVVVAGPFMDAAARGRLDELAAGRPDRHVLGFLEDCAPLLAGAEAVVAMGGYNTTVELLALGIPALIVPRTKPRREQLIRAERLAALGLLDLLHPAALSPQALSDWLASTDLRDRPGTAIDLDGLARLPSLLDDLWSKGPRSQEHASGGHFRVAS